MKEVEYLTDVYVRMGQDELMRISRALAMFRPSFISTMVSLTEEDLIYMEKCVQRTLMVRFCFTFMYQLLKGNNRNMRSLSAFQVLLQLFGEGLARSYL